jgi:hypothetical protein
VSYTIINSKVQGDYRIDVIGFNGDATNPYLEVRNDAGGGYNQEAKFIDSISSNDFCKLVEVLEFSRSAVEFDCTKSGFCVIHPSISFCGVDNDTYSSYMKSVGLEEGNKFSGSLLYNYTSGEWCYVERDVNCDALSEFSNECSSGDLLKDYVNIYSPSNAKCYKENEYISWYFQGNIDEDEYLNKYYCIGIYLDSPTDATYDKPSGCKKINSDWKSEFGKYDHILYLKYPKDAGYVKVEMGIK